MKPLHHAFLLIVLLFPVGCASIRAVPEQLPPLPDPAEYVQAALNVQQQACQAGIARITIKVQDTSRSYKAVYASRHPDELRLEVLGLFNQPGLYISANPETGITLYIPSKNSWYRGPATAESMQRISGILMDPLEIVQTIHNSPPGPALEQARISCMQDSGNYKCRLEQEKTIQDIWIDPESSTIMRSRLYKNGLAVHDIRYQDFLQLDGRFIPGKILITFDRYATSLEIKLRSPLTTPLAARQLRLQAPDETEFLPLNSFFEAQ